MDIKAFHDLFRFMLDKEQGGWLSPEEIDVLTDRSQMWLFKEMISFYGKSSQESGALSPFIQGPKTVIAGADGGIVIPGFELLLSLGVKIYNPLIGSEEVIPVRIVGQDEADTAIRSQISPVTKERPIAVENGSGRYMLYPKYAYAAQVRYMGRPPAPKYAYAAGVDDRELEYDAGGSTGLAWGEQWINKILVKALQLAGVSINDELVIQYSELKDREGI